jgi:uncharacterized protein (TIGR02145 family)
VIDGNKKTFAKNLAKTDMEKAKTVVRMAGVFALVLSYGNLSGNVDYPEGSTSVRTGSIFIQTQTKSAQTVSKSVQTKSKATQTKSKSPQKSTKSETDSKSNDAGTVTIGKQKWAIANLNVSTFRNGDSIPEARTNKEWLAAGESGKPAWCYYNNNQAIGLKYGKLYNWYAVSDPRGLVPAGWTLASDDDWTRLINFLGGQGAAGNKMKSTSGWGDGNNGTNEAGFIGLPGGYRVENGTFQNLGSIGIWWSSSESRAQDGIDHYISQSPGLNRGNSPKQRGESVRCLKE